MLLPNAPGHALREIGLKFPAPAADGFAGIETFGEGQITPPAVVGLAILAAPTGLRRVGGIVAAARKKEKPRGRVAFLQAAVRIGPGVGFRRVERAQRAPAENVFRNP